MTATTRHGRPARFGVGLQSGYDTARFARLAEERGFDYVASGEHLAFHGPTNNSFVALSVAAGATTTIGLLSAVTLLPLYPPALAAKLAAALDVASGGRFTMGVGVGGENPTEFEAVGVPVAERGARTDESLTIMRRLLTEEAVTVDSRFTSFSGLTIAPKPARHVPIWIAGRRSAALRRAARFGDAWLPYLATPEQVAAGITTLDELSDGPRWTGRVALYAFVNAGRDGRAARRAAAERVGMTYRQDFTGRTSRYLVAGTPADCASRLREYLDAGADVVLFRLACPRDQAESMLALIADEIIPDLRLYRNGHSRTPKWPLG